MKTAVTLATTAIFAALAAAPAPVLVTGPSAPAPITTPAPEPAAPILFEPMPALFGGLQEFCATCQTGQNPFVPLENSSAPPALPQTTKQIAAFQPVTTTETRTRIVWKPTKETFKVKVTRHVPVETAICGTCQPLSSVVVSATDENIEENRVRYFGRRRAVYSSETGRFHRRNGRPVFFDGNGWYPGKFLGRSPPGFQQSYQ